MPLMAPDLVHLAADGGAVIGFTLPLPEHVEKQWTAGELTRVHKDGTEWDEAEDDPDALAETSDPAGGVSAEPGGDDFTLPVRPRDSAHRRHWQAYAVALGAATGDEVDGMTKAQLVELVTPPEEQPPDLEAGT
jgi:hypothetical protein